MPGVRVVCAVRAPPSVVDGVVMTWFEHGVAHVAGNGLSRAVEAALADPVPQLTDAGALRVVGDGGGLRDRVGVHGDHARLTGQHGLGDVLAGRPLNAGDLEDSGGGAVTVRVRVVVVAAAGVLVRGHRPASTLEGLVLVES
jgi:hypothetical protein